MGEMKYMPRLRAPRGTPPRWEALVCEDDMADRKLARLVLGSCRFEVVAYAEFASEALQQAALLQPHVAIVDLHLRGMSGFEVIAGIRAVAPQTAVIIFTADDAARYDPFAARAFAVVDKTDPESLARALDQLVGRQRPSRLPLLERRCPQWAPERRMNDTGSVLTRLLDLDDVGRRVASQLENVT